MPVQMVYHQLVDVLSTGFVGTTDTTLGQVASPGHNRLHAISFDMVPVGFILCMCT
jgi:hypothetical protein